MPIDLTKVAEMRTELEARGKALDERIVKFREKWAPAVFQRPEFGSDLLDLCETWGKWGADSVLLEMVDQWGHKGVDSGGGAQMAGESGSRSGRASKRARSNQKNPWK